MNCYYQLVERLFAGTMKVCICWCWCWCYMLLSLFVKYVNIQIMTKALPKHYFSAEKLCFTVLCNRFVSFLHPIAFELLKYFEEDDASVHAFDVLVSWRSPNCEFTWIKRQFLQLPFSNVFRWLVWLKQDEALKSQNSLNFNSPQYLYEKNLCNLLYDLWVCILGKCQG